MSNFGSHVAYVKLMKLSSNRQAHLTLLVHPHRMQSILSGSHSLVQASALFYPVDWPGSWRRLLQQLQLGKQLSNASASALFLPTYLQKDHRKSKPVRAQFDAVLHVEKL